MSAKRNTSWIGYKVHLTETYPEDGPHLITHVETTAATLPDCQALDSIHSALHARNVRPSEHMVDAGYMNSIQLVDSTTKHQIDLFGPVPLDSAWQAHTADAFDIACFAVDWDAQIVTCPTGQTSRAWKPTHKQHGQDVIHVEFDRQTCATCPVRARCTKSKTTGREVTLRPREYHIALQTARQRQTTPEFKAAYAARSGIEGTLSQGIRVCELRQARNRGQTKTRLQNVLIATALNLLRVLAW